jgi:hypothetical protein
MNIMIINLDLDLRNIITYCSSILPSSLDFIYCSIIIMILTILIYYSRKWIKIIVNGVERLVPVAAVGFYINYYLGILITVPNLGSENKGTDNKDNKDTKGTYNKYNNDNKGNKSENNASKSILFSIFINSLKSKKENIKIRHSFILTFILNTIDINIPEGSEALTNYAFGVMLMSLVALLCFINVLGYFISFYILDKYNIETRFPKLSKIKTYYQNTTLIFIIYESLFCICILLFLIITAYLYLKKIVTTS